MTNNDPTKDPFYSGSHAGHHFFFMTADDRVKRAREFTREECLLALAKTDLQKMVRTAVERRLKQLDKAGATI